MLLIAANLRKLKQPGMEKKKRQPVMGGFLPEDVLIEILIRLPVRALLRLNCVSKSWNSLISSHQFSKTHLRHSKRHSNFQHRIIILSDRELKHYLSLDCALNGPIFDVSERCRVVSACEEDPLEKKSVYFVDSCDGLICIAVGTDEHRSGNDVVLWNPSTQKIKKLPDFGVESGYEFYRSYGFGFDESCDDYKVVGFYFSLTDKFDVLVKIFSLKTGELKRIKNHEGRWIVNYPPIFANGKIHWFVQAKPESNKKWYVHRYIVYLDLATEEYGILEKPEFFNFGPCSSMMALSGGRLYVYWYSSLTAQVWLVEPGYGVKETKWTKVISRYDYGDEDKYLGFHNPLFVFDNGEIVLLFKRKIVIVNPNDRSIRYPQLGTSQDFHTGIAHVESLVSPMTL